MQKKLLFVLLTICINSQVIIGQGLNHNWLIGYLNYFDQYSTSEKARMTFDSNTVSVLPETRKMTFDAAQSNISDENGNLLFATNGQWIANSTGDTMLNGSGINPGACTNAWSYGLPIVSSSIVLPFPGNSSKFALLHQTCNGSAQYGFMASELYFSIIDITQDSGRGAVISKNNIIVQDHLNQGITACKHANGRDWWIVVLKDSTDSIYNILLTPQGITSITTQSLNVYHHNYYNGQPVFSPDGNKFSYHYVSGNSPNKVHRIRISNFDRCTGVFSNTKSINVTSTEDGLGLAFSPDSKYLYFSSFHELFQLNTDTSNILASKQVVAINDTFYSPFSPFQTNFWLMYLAANGKIYLSSGNSVLHMHYINYPDSGGTACNVQQHAIHLPCWYFRGNVNHPNYYLGPVIGSVCDSLVHVGVNEYDGHDFHFSLSPNPITAGYMKIVYLLPQNKSGLLEVFDINGRVVYKMPLPPWSTLQQVKLPQLANGIYNAVITSGEQRKGTKIAITDLID